ncbi:MAG: carboxypeptidase M32 [Eubacteriales bacterium]
MDRELALKTLEQNQASLRALEHASNILFIDGATVAPSGSAPYRAKTFGELSKMMYDLTTDKDAVSALEYLYETRDTLDFITRRHVEELYRNLDLTRKVPKEEAAEFEVLCNESYAVWHDAKEQDDFSLFEPYLERVYSGVMKRANYYDPERDPYEVCLDLYERGLTRDKCDAFFSEIKCRIAPLIRKVRSCPQPDDSRINALYSIEEQRKISDFCMKTMKIDPRYCTLGETEHPFTSEINKFDVRITTHYYADSFLSSLYSVIHEGGHALYELNVADELLETCLATGCSMAIHESQSRFYENYIGRSREFTSLLYDYLDGEFPNRLDGVSKSDFYRMINKSTPSLVRTEADELTYSMHIIIRYELEKMMFDGKLTVHDLPREWNRLYGEYLGVEVTDCKHGILQDSHWSDGGIGYFPSYSIGSAYGAQYLRKMREEFDPYEEIAKGDLTKINGWLCDRIWRHGMLYSPTELFENVCGKLDAGVYADYLEKKFGELYGI